MYVGEKIKIKYKVINPGKQRIDGLGLEMTWPDHNGVILRKAATFPPIKGRHGQGKNGPISTSSSIAWSGLSIPAHKARSFSFIFETPLCLVRLVVCVWTGSETCCVHRHIHT